MPMANAGRSKREKFWQLDPIGTALFLASIVCLLLALQWGGAKYQWSNGRIIALLVLFAVLLITWMVLQVIRPVDRTTVPLHLIKDRNITGSMLYALLGGGLMVILALYLPIW